MDLPIVLILLGWDGSSDLTKIWQFMFLLFPKGEFLRTHRVGPLGLSGSLHLGLFLKFLPPYEPWPLFSRFGGCGGGGWCSGA